LKDLIYQTWGKEIYFLMLSQTPAHPNVIKLSGFHYCTFIEESRGVSCSENEKLQIVNRNCYPEKRLSKNQN